MTWTNTQPNLSHLGVCIPATSSKCKRVIATVWLHVTMIQGTFASYIVLHARGKKAIAHHISLLHLQSTSIFKVYPRPSPHLSSVLRSYAAIGLVHRKLPSHRSRSLRDAPKRAVARRWSGPEGSTVSLCSSCKAWGMIRWIHNIMYGYIPQFGYIIWIWISYICGGETYPSGIHDMNGWMDMRCIVFEAGYGRMKK